jgi:hypothetical protein
MRSRISSGAHSGSRSLPETCLTSPPSSIPSFFK